MPSLEAIQSSMAETIAHGPDWCPVDLFSGPAERILLGLKAHANTISHARLVAMEQSFPRTRAAMGEGVFNALSRTYVDLPEPAEAPLAQIGTHFPVVLANSSDTETYAALARLELAWLESYHARQAEPLTLPALAGLNEAQLLQLPIVAHPAARLVEPGVGLPAQPDWDNGTLANACFVLITRPNFAVGLTAADGAMHDLFCELPSMQCRQPVSIGDIFSRLLERDPESYPLLPFLTLVGAGAISLLEVDG